MPSKRQVVIGKVGKTYGVQGWVKIYSYLENAAEILTYSSLSFEGPQETLKIEEGKVQGNQLVVKFVGIDTPEAARLLTGKLITLSRDQLPALKKNEYYWSDLEGLTVIDQAGTHLGTVSHLISTGANDVLIVKGKVTHAIPYLPGKVVLKVDLDKQEIYVDWQII